MQGQTDELLIRGVANVIPNKEELAKLLASGKKLNIYLGIDPTATKIHLGHAVPLRKIQAFAALGHNVTFLIGDFTALIGDTSDKDTERPILTSKEIEENFLTYKRQAEKILDFSKIKVRHNSEWLSKLDFKEVVKLAQQFDFGEFANRELIKKRLTSGQHVGLHEALYPVMQGYDSYFLDTDIQIGGTDQTFNMQAGRTLQKKWREKESFILAMNFLTGTDGRKMSKSWGNAIWLEDTPEDMYGKVMAIEDSLIAEYFLLGTNVSLEKVREVESRLKGENPRDLKRELALQIVTELYSQETAQKAREHFEATIVRKEMPKDIPIFLVEDSHKAGATIADIMVSSGLAVSKSEARRLIEQGGVTYNNEKVEDAHELFIPENGAVLQVGKRNFRQIEVE